MPRGLRRAGAARATAAALLAASVSGCGAFGALSAPEFVRPGSHRVRAESQAARDAVGRVADYLDGTLFTLALPIPYFTLAFGRDEFGRRWSEEAALREGARDLAGVLAALGPPTEWTGDEAGGATLSYRYDRARYFFSEFAIRAPYYGWVQLFEWDATSGWYDELRVVVDAQERVVSWAYREDVPAR